jgi:hypothetical protein
LCNPKVHYLVHRRSERDTEIKRGRCKKRNEERRNRERETKGKKEKGKRKN